MRDLNTNLRSPPQRGSEIDFKQEYRKSLGTWLSSWREAFQSKNFTSDWIAGITVAAVALPLNLALAVASGLPPSAGLIAGAIGGGIAALFGGQSYQVSGPAAALNFMVFMIVAQYGVAGAAGAALVCGVVALLLSLTLAGKLARFFPAAVLGGFTTGVGIKLLDGQLPELLGFDYKVAELASMIARPAWLHEVSWLAVVCGLFVAFLVMATKAYKRFPAALIGVSIVTGLSVYLDWDIKRVGEIPSVLPMPSLPNIEASQWFDLIMRCIPLALLGAVESLLSATAIDRMRQGAKPHDPNLELFGQGLANLGSGIFGGMPVTGVVVRSTVNLQSGSKSRMSALIHAAILLMSVLYLSDALAKIPLAGLAGLLVVIGFRLIEIKEFVHLVHKERVAALAFAVTLVGTVTGHLVQGLAAGMLIMGAQWFFTRKKRRILEVKAELQSEGIRAVLGRGHAEARRPGHYEPAAERSNWVHHVRDRAVVPRSAFVHKDATVIGRVVLGDHVHVAAGSSIRADEGTPFFIGSNSNVQDGVVLHALKEKKVRVAGEEWAIYVGSNVSMAHQALIHGPCYIGDHSFIGFKAVVHDCIIGAHCYIGIGAVVVGVEIPDGRYVPHGMIVDTADKVDALPRVTDKHMEFNEDVVEVNRGLAAAYRSTQPTQFPNEKLTKLPRMPSRIGVLNSQDRF